MRIPSYAALVLASPALFAAALSTPAMAQQAAADDDIIVTARRTEERLQDVPASIAVFNQEQLDNQNVTNLGDIGHFTPGVYASSRFGDDNTSFSIRGFTQELRTTASVGVFFADVVAPRAGGAITGGDGAGPGSVFDLQNLQVLRGPQGTLFGRNTTGGAILLVPRRPGYDYDGYLEGSVGDFDMQRIQGVVNVPINDHVRVRVGVDHQQRDGYLENVGIGGDLSDVNYTTGRFSLVWDVTDNIENYTIVQYTNSENSGSVAQVFACNTARPAGLLCAGAGQNSPPANFYQVTSDQPNPYSNIEQSAIINTTTWTVSDNFTVKNIFAVQSFELALQGPVFGSNWRIGPTPFLFANAGAHPFGPAMSTDGLVEELQFQGHTDRLRWQAGLYYEHTDPDGIYGQQSISNLACNVGTTGDANPANFRCDDPFNSLLNPLLGNIIRQSGMLEFTNQAIYAQGTYDFSDQLALTVGVRYTKDETEANVQQIVWLFDDNPAAGNQHVTNGVLEAPTLLDCANPNLTPANGHLTSNIQPVAGDCSSRISQDSDAPTWTLGLDYTPSDNLLIYGKYSRGYRQGGIVAYAVPGLQTYDPEEVDTYEIGFKSSFDAPFRGVFNAAIFYNDFRDQQIQAGTLPTSGSGTTAIVNAGSSTIQGLELETRVELFRGFELALSYAYLDTELKELTPVSINSAFQGQCGPTVDPNPPIIIACPSYTVAVGEPLPYSPENQVSLTASYKLPTPETVGDVTLSATYFWTDEQQATATASSPFNTIDAYGLLSFNVNWDGIAGSNVDGALFVNNALDEEYVNFVSGGYTSSGFESRVVGQPFMAGVRLRYRFGGGE